MSARLLCSCASAFFFLFLFPFLFRVLILKRTRVCVCVSGGRLKSAIDALTNSAQFAIHNLHAAVRLRSSAPPRVPAPAGGVRMFRDHHHHPPPYDRATIMSPMNTARATGSVVKTRARVCLCKVPLKSGCKNGL